MKGTTFLILLIIVFFALDFIIHKVIRYRSLLREKRRNTIEKWDFVELLKDYKKDDLKLTRGETLLIRNNFWMDDYGDSVTEFKRADVIDGITENGKPIRFINKSKLLIRKPFKEVPLEKRKLFYSNHLVKYDIPEEYIRLNI